MPKVANARARVHGPLPGPGVSVHHLTSQPVPPSLFSVKVTGALFIT